MAKRIYWDSCVFIDRIARHPDRIEVLEEITDSARSGRAIIVASTLCIAETCKIKVEGEEAIDDWPVTQRLILDFFENPWIEVVQLDSYIAELAQTIAHNHPLGASDAVHVATAIMRNCEVLHTYDGVSRKKRRTLLKCHDKIRFRADGTVGTTGFAIKVPARIDPQKPLGFTDAEASDETKGRADAVPEDAGPYSEAAGSSEEGVRPRRHIIRRRKSASEEKEET